MKIPPLPDFNEALAEVHLAVRQQFRDVLINVSDQDLVLACIQAAGNLLLAKSIERAAYRITIPNEFGDD